MDLLLEIHSLTISWNLLQGMKPCFMQGNLLQFSSSLHVLMMPLSLITSPPLTVLA
ncbi:hypothetical protein RchiOBHm_Chr2g0142671 [Rosa chinensis]|uniref:Uncharacterized protein n=1 Tax=Rosa chinensis TaxID=74649 RepID=A0A2P6RXX7_ROSCH|nr:hypothetical protein RchiOBHm_Chr2g0142671 [Rosa chinensis]